MDISSDEDEPAVNVPPEAEIESEVLPAEDDQREFDTVPINGVKRVQLDEIDEVENVIKWFTNDER